MVDHFMSKSSKFCIVQTIRFVQISPTCGPNTYEIMYGETYNVGISNSNMKYLIRKSIFAVKLTLKLFPAATVANAEIESLKSLCTFLKKVLVPHAGEI